MIREKYATATLTRRKVVSYVSRNSITYHKVDAGGSDGCDDIDLLHKEEVDDNLGDGIEGNTHVNGHGARDHVKVVGLDQHGSDQREHPRDDVQRHD